VSVITMMIRASPKYDFKTGGMASKRFYGPEKGLQDQHTTTALPHST
jgi:hypothetical protein